MLRAPCSVQSNNTAQQKGADIFENGSQVSSSLPLTVKRHRKNRSCHCLQTTFTRVTFSTGNSTAGSSVYSNAANPNAEQSPANEEAPPATNNSTQDGSSTGGVVRSSSGPAAPASSMISSGSR